MLDSLSYWLHETPLGEALLTMFISMLPVVELRGGLPAGVAMGLPIPAAFFSSLVGNMIPVPFVILFVRPLFRWVRIHIPKLGHFVSTLEARAQAKSVNVVRYQTWGLLLFVAIPLPGTGAWTGSLIAAMLEMRRRAQYALEACRAGHLPRRRHRGLHHHHTDARGQSAYLNRPHKGGVLSRERMPLLYFFSS